VIAEKPKPVLLCFTSPTDGRCRRVDGFVAQILQRRRNHETFTLRRIDPDSRRDLARRLRVENVPTLLVVDDGKVRGRLASPKGCADIQDLLAPWLH
jgi:thioredoxin-like negative regulator of GroEL